MTAETAQKLHFCLERMACLEPCFKRVSDAKESLAKLLDKLKIVEEFWKYLKIFLIQCVTGL